MGLLLPHATLTVSPSIVTLPPPLRSAANSADWRVSKLTNATLDVATRTTDLSADSGRAVVERKKERIWASVMVGGREVRKREV